MPRTTNNSSIKTIWENNNDTPITATNLSKALDLIASYKNFNVSDMVGVPDDFHGEYSLLAINPLDSSQLLFKRGSILQIINEATDDLGNPIVDKNSHYKIFDVGLDDIIITPNDTDATLIGDKSSWGGDGETKQWFVYLADKDDSSVYNKGTPDEYGGGAQIIVSRNNDGPYRAQVPGRPLDEYSIDDTRIIGGFKTSGDTILEVWDIAGKYYEVKSKKGYFILDELNDTNVYDYRRIDFRDLNTDRNSELVGSLTVQGNTNLLDGLSGSGNINLSTDNFKISSTDILTSFEFDGDANTITIDSDVQHSGNFNMTGDITSSGNIDLDGIITHSGIYNLEGTYNQTGRLNLTGRLSQTGPVSLGSTQTTPINSTGIWTHNGLFDHSGIYRIQGSVEVTGQYELVSDELTIRTETPFGHDGGGNPLYQFFQFVVPNPGANEDPSMYTYHQGRMEVNGGTYSHGGSASFSINWTGDSEMTVFAHEYNYNDAGTAPYGGYNITSDFRVKKNNSEPIIEVINEDKTTQIIGSSTFVIEDNDTVSVTGDGTSILTIEKDPSRNVILNGDLTIINGSLHGSVTGNSDTATEFESPLTLNFSSPSSDMSDGSVTIHGNESNMVVDLMIDKSKWYNIADLDPSPGTPFDTGVLDTRYYKISSIDPAPGSPFGTGVLDTRYYTITQIQDLFSGGGSFNLNWIAIDDKPNINLVGGVSGTLDLSNNEITQVDIQVLPDEHVHSNYYTITDLNTATATDGDTVPRIHWNVLTDIYFGNTGVSDYISRSDHTHTLITDIDMTLGSNIVLKEDTLVSLSGTMLDIIEFEVVTLMGIRGTELVGTYFILQSSDTPDFIKFWFDMTGTDSEPIYSGTVTSTSYRIDLSLLSTLDDYITAISTAINDSGAFVSEVNQYNVIEIRYQFETNFNPEFPMASDFELIDINQLSASGYEFNLKVDSIISDPGSNTQIGVDENFVLTKDGHLSLEHKYLSTSKDQFMLDSTSANFLTIDPPPEHASEMYSQIRELAAPSTHTPDLFEKSEADRIAIHVNNIYVPNDYTPGGASSRDYLDVTSTLDTGTGQVTSYTINDTPILSYIESNYYSKDEIDGGALTTVYSKTELDPNPGDDAGTGVLDSRYYTQTNVDSNISTALGDYYNKSYIDNNLYLQSDVYTKTELDPNPGSDTGTGILDTRYHTRSEITNDYYDRSHIDTYHYTTTQADANFQEKETSNWSNDTPEEFLYARVFISGRPTNPQLGDIHINGSLVEICVDAGIPFWTQLSN